MTSVASQTRLARWWDGDLAYGFRRSPVAIVSALVLAVCLVAALFAPWIAPHNPFDLATLNLTDALAPPHGMAGARPEYLLGTDDQGRDVLSAIMFGTRISLLVGVAAVALSVMMGVSLGLVSGYSGGRLDAFIMRAADVQLSFPAILIALLIDGVARAVLPRGAHGDVALVVLIVAIGVSNWPTYARTVRSSTLVEKGKEYVQAARVIGITPAAILFRHLLPSVIAGALLAVEGLRVEFPTRQGTLVAVDGVSLTIAPGEVLGVVGESGAGKSLTGAAVIGLIDPPGRIGAGEIRLDGRRIDNLPPEALRRIRGREIGAVFQDPLTSLNPLYTIGQQLGETITTHLDLTPAAAKARALELLGEVGITAPKRRFNHYPHQFSGGMRQRVVIALALAAKPRLIIADEPTTALDVSIQAQIIALLKGLCRDHGTAVMLITHDMGVIAETADRVAVMYAGRIVEVGPVADVIHRPQHPYTRGLMGSIPTIAADREALEQIDGTMPRLTAIPGGCAFHPRCPHAFDRCRRDRPELMAAGATRSACWLVLR